MSRTLPLALALAALSIFTACGGSSGAKLRLVNAIPDLPSQAFDVAIDGKVVQTSVLFHSVTPATGYLSVASGSRHLQLFPPGTTTGPYFDGNISLNSGSAYTVVATGNVSNNTIVAPLFTDSNTAPTSGNGELRVIQASPSGLGVPNGAVDIYVTSVGGGLGTSPDISNVTFPTASSYLNIPAGTDDILVTPGGIKAIDITIPSATFSAGKIYTYVLLDVQNGGQMSQNPLALTDN